MRNVLVLRWIALGLATLAGVWWLVSAVGHLVAGEEPLTIEGALLGVLIVACLTGVGLGAVAGAGPGSPPERRRWCLASEQTRRYRDGCCRCESFFQ